MVTERQAAQLSAAEFAQRKWNRADDLKESVTPYLENKGVQGYGLKQDDMGNTLVPLRDVKGELWSLQTIFPDGAKRFSKGGRISGLMHVIDPVDKYDGQSGPNSISDFDKETIFIVEGYATGATVHELTRQCTVVALNANNLKPVAVSIREQNPTAMIVIAADNDHKLEDRPMGNVGTKKGQEAAEAVDGIMVVPDLTDRQKSEGITDWNDLANDKGNAMVIKQIRKQLKQHKIIEKPRAVSLGL